MHDIKYTCEELFTLRESPLVVKPETLPAVEQWIDSTSEQQKKQRTHSSLQSGRSDDAEHPLKRPSPLESRSRVSHGGAREDIFLGPRTSFASANAARQPGRAISNEERPESQDQKPSLERVGGRDRNNWEKDGDRSRRDLANGEQEEGRPRLRLRKDHDGENEWASKRSSRQPQWPDQGSKEDTGARRRSGFDRAKLEQSWLRDGKKSTANGEKGHESEDLRSPTERFRDHDWSSRRNRDMTEQRKDSSRSSRVEHDPSWMKENTSPESAEPAMTQDDFKKWKAQMKAVKSGSAEKPTNPEEKPEASSSVLEQEQAPNEKEHPHVPLFGLLGSTGANEQKLDGKIVLTSKAGASKPKPSRFANFFAPTNPVPEPEPATVQDNVSTEQLNPAAGGSKEDQEGFVRIMQQLRMAGTASQSQSNSGFLPPSDPPELDDDKHHHHHTGANGVENQGQIHNPGFHSTSPPQNHKAAAPPTQRQEKKAEFDAPNKDSEFLLNLMKQQQPETPSVAEQVHGHNITRAKEPDDIASLMNNRFRPPQPSQPQLTRPKQPQTLPPGFFENEHAFNRNHGIDLSLAHDQTPRGPQIPNEFFEDPHQAQQRHISPQEFFRNQPQAQLNNDHRRLSGPPPFHANPPNREHVAPPPGFSTSTRGPGAPPGFFHGPPQANHAPPAIRPPNLHMPPPMQNQNFFQQQQQQSPMFNNMPPGFGGGPSPMHPNMPPPHHQRRPPSQHMPPGFDMISPGGGGPGGVRAPMQAHHHGGFGLPSPGMVAPGGMNGGHGAYPQYLKQGGGTGAFHGI